MRQLFTRFLMASLALISIVNAHAKVDPFYFTDGEIILGQTYQVPSFCSAEGKFTAPSSGLLVQSGVPDLYIEGLQPVTNSALPSYGEYGQMWTWNVEEGVTYTVKASMVLNGGPVMFIMAADYEPKVVELEPQEGSEITPLVNLTGNINIRFNSAISLSTASLIAGEETIALGYTQPASNVISLNVAQPLNSLYKNGTISKDGGDPLQIVITGINNSVKVPFNGDGVLKLNYVAGPNPANLISSSIYDGSTLKSYYPEGDPEGIFTFVFDADLSTTAGTHLQLTAGDVENEDSYYFEQIPVVIDGATITADLTGKLRDLTKNAHYNDIVKDGGFVGAKLINVRDKDGNITVGSGQGNIGSYSFTLVYKYLQPLNIVSEFLPMSGTSLKNTETLEIWFTNSSNISYEGVVFKYDENNETKEIVVLRDQCDISVSGNETTLLVKVPNEIKGKPVEVSLYNMVSYDGYDHSRQVMAYYDQFIATLIEPITENSRIESTGTSDFVIRVNTQPAYMRYDFYNRVTKEHPDGWCGGAQFTQKGDYWYAPNKDYTCYKDFDPYMVVSTYDSESDYTQGVAANATFTFYFIGTTNSFEYSVAAFTSIEPEANSKLSAPFDNFFFTVVFDSMVTIDNESSGLSEGLDSQLVPFAQLVPVDSDGNDFATTWKLYPNVDFLENHAEVIVNIKAYDYEGLLVQGNANEFESSILAFTYSIDNVQGIIDLNSDVNQAYEVYNLQGMRIITTNAASAIRSLPAGLYIINGKKTLIK